MPDTTTVTIAFAAMIRTGATEQDLARRGGATVPRPHHEGAQRGPASGHDRGRAARDCGGEETALKGTKP